MLQADRGDGTLVGRVDHRTEIQEEKRVAPGRTHRAASFVGRQAACVVVSASASAVTGVYIDFRASMR